MAAVVFSWHTRCRPMVEPHRPASAQRLHRMIELPMEREQPIAGDGCQWQSAIYSFDQLRL